MDFFFFRKTFPKQCYDSASETYERGKTKNAKEFRMFDY